MSFLFAGKLRGMLFVVILVCFWSVQCTHTERSRVVGWYNGLPALASVPWGLYTHVKYGAPTIASDGRASCNHTLMDAFVQAAHAHGVAALWGVGLPAHFIAEKSTPQAFWDSIGSATRECAVDGIESDYEHVADPWGVVLPSQATQYSLWLAQLRVALGKNKTVSADVGVWGVAPGNYVLVSEESVCVVRPG